MGRVVVDVDVRGTAHLCNCIKLLGRVDCDGSDASSIFGIEGSFVFGEVVVNGIGNTCRVDYAISVEHQRVVSFETVVPVESV